jgi:hypothetical protein
MKPTKEAYKILRKAIGDLRLPNVQKVKLLKQAYNALDEAHFNGYSVGIGLAEEIIDRPIPKYEQEEYLMYRDT